MNSEQGDLRKCVRCHSTMLASFFDYSRKGCRYKTCNNCREKAGPRLNPKVKCLCGEELLWGSLDRHAYSQKHMQWKENNTFICDCGHSVLIKDKDKHFNSFIHGLKTALETEEVKRFNNTCEWTEPPEGG